MKRYKFKTAWVIEYQRENEKWVQFSWEDGLIIAWNTATGEGRIISYAQTNNN